MTSNTVAIQGSDAAIFEHYRSLSGRLEQVLSICSEQDSLTEYAFQIDDVLIELNFWYETVNNHGKNLQIKVENAQITSLLRALFQKASDSTLKLQSALTHAEEFGPSSFPAEQPIRHFSVRKTHTPERGAPKLLQELQKVIRSIADLSEVITHFAKSDDKDPSAFAGSTEVHLPKIVHYEYHRPPLSQKEDLPKRKTDPRQTLPYGLRQYATDVPYKSSYHSKMPSSILPIIVESPLLSGPNLAEKPASFMSLTDYRRQVPLLYWGHLGEQGPRVPVDDDRTLEDIGGFVSLRVRTVQDEEFVTVAAKCRTKHGQDEYLAIKFQESDDGASELQNEFQILRRLYHNHIAACVGPGIRKYPTGSLAGLVYFPLASNLATRLEMLSGSNADQGESKNKSHQESVPHMKRLFSCLCRTILYLEEQNYPISHGDIDPHNILLDAQGHVVLVGFGKWTHIEYEREFQWDIFSLGCVFLETATVIMGETLLSLRQHLCSSSDDQSPDVEEVIVYYDDALAKGLIRTWIMHLSNIPVSKINEAWIDMFHNDQRQVKRFVETIYNVLADASEPNALRRALEGFDVLFQPDCEHCLLKEEISMSSLISKLPSNEGSNLESPIRDTGSTLQIKTMVDITPVSQYKHIWVVMGPTGSGKTTVAQHLRDALSLPYLEGEELHPPANAQKMANGQPLTDAERWDWLVSLRETTMDTLSSHNSPGVIVTCPITDRKYRDVIRVAAMGNTDVQIHFLVLRVTEENALARTQEKQSHYLKGRMVRTQFESFGVRDLGNDESDVSTVNANASLVEVQDAALRAVKKTMERSQV